MAILNFTPGDKLASTVIDSGWYTAVLETIDGPKKSGSGKSVNFFNDFKITKGPFVEKLIPYNMTSGSDKSSILGTMQWNPHTHYMHVAAAVLRVPFGEVPLNLDTEDLLHKEIDIKVEKVIAEGVVMNIIIGFLPAGEGSKQTIPF
jgi:hypothetical protein